MPGPSIPPLIRPTHAPNPKGSPLFPPCAVAAELKCAIAPASWIASVVHSSRSAVPMHPPERSRAPSTRALAIWRATSRTPTLMSPRGANEKSRDAVRPPETHSEARSAAIARTERCPRRVPSCSNRPKPQETRQAHPHARTNSGMRRAEPALPPIRETASDSPGLFQRNPPKTAVPL